MFEKIKRFVSVLLILFLAIGLIVAVLTIWDIISKETAGEIFVKLAYTFGATLLVALLGALIAKKNE